MHPLSLTGKRWRVGKDLRPESDSLLAHQWRESSFAVLSTLAEERGFKTLEDIGKRGLPGMDAHLFPDLPKAMDRIEAATTKKETITIFGDYDCDGVTSTAQLVRFFRRRGIEPMVRLPHRVDDGYGLKEKHIEECRAQGTTLLLTVDTGISAAKEIALARSAGIDVIVLDHHHVPDVLPDAYALLHPSLCVESIASPPSAAGVAWSVVRALEEHADGVGILWEDRETDLALAAIGTVADLVELRGSNRDLVRAGLDALMSMTGGPLFLLMEQAGLHPPITSRDIAFRIAPRLNAAGRMDDPMIALRAMLGDRESLTALEELNRNRQDFLSILLKFAEREMKNAALPFLCLASSEYPPGLAGLIASKLTESTGRPSLVAGIQGNLCTASLRSIPGYHITEALASCKEFLTSYGGHAQAAGCTFPLASFQAIQEQLSADLLSKMPAEELLPGIALDAVLSESQVTLDLCERLREFEPFGQGNMEPRFLIPNVLLQDVRTVGRESTHLQARLNDKKVIGFGLGSLLNEMNQPVDLACRLGVDTWNGKSSAQVFMDDIRPAERQDVHRQAATAQTQQHVSR